MPPNEQAFFNELYAQFQEEQKQTQKDILIVAHNQLDYIKECVESILECTYNFILYIWDNASDTPTKRYLEYLSENHSKIKLSRSEENLGFIIPNNRLAEKGNSEYIILLNSDTKVKPGWDNGLVGFLETFSNYAQVGYIGGLLNTDCRGGDVFDCGDEIDFIPGWCFCVHRKTFERYGLFDEKNLEFAYGEDSDFSLRLKAAGHKIYALHLDLVLHHGNRTVFEVQNKRKMTDTFYQNHQYLRSKWRHYLENQRILSPSRQRL